MYLEDWRVGLALSAFAVTALVLMTRLRSLAVPHWTAEREAAAQFYGFLGEQLSSTEDVRANGARDWVMMRFYQHSRVWLKHRVWGMAMNSVMWASSISAFSVANAIAFALGAWLYRAGDISIGTVYVIFYYTELLRRPIEFIRAQLLKEVTFRLEPGRVLGLLGRTGSGKTTIARLVFRLYDPDEGEVRLGGIPIASAKLEELRDRVGMVTQDVQIFDASIRDNLAFFDRSIPDDALLAVVEEVGLGAWLAAQPRGLDSQISDSGLSAGEAQLLAFARLFLADPGLVILDEASSRLDPATERLVERAVSRLLDRRSAILIAHRLATVERADDVLILEDGMVVEHGRRAELTADPESRLSRLLVADMQGVLA
jgi:ATP-binding cassette subfamily B protein